MAKTKQNKRQNLCQSDFTAGNNINKLKELSMLLDIFLDKILQKNVKRKPVLKGYAKWDPFNKDSYR